MLKGRVALVTGASRGIGRAIAERLHQEGMDVAIVARSLDRLTAVGQELRARDGGRVLALAADVTDSASVREVVAATEKHLGAVDLLVNNAGLADNTDQRLWEMDPEEWWDVITTNVRGPMLFSHAALPGMTARGSGRIININSSRSVRVSPTQTAYGVSKCALAKLTQSLAAALAGTGIYVFDYSPGRVKTDLTRSLYSDTVPDSDYTPMANAVDGVVAIARGRLDRLAGRFVHAHDDLDDLSRRADEIVRNNGRTLVLSEAYEHDPLTQRVTGR